MRQASVPSRDVAGTAPGSTSSEAGLGVPAHDRQRSADEWRNPRGARNAFLWPTLLVVLLLAIFPMVASLGLALSNLQLVQGGFQIKFIGLTNFSNLFFGADRTQFLGQFRPPTIIGWVFFVGGTALTAWAFVRYLRGRSVNPLGIVGRAAGAVALIALLWLVANTLLAQGGRPGTLVVTFIYVIVGHEPAVSDRSRAGDADHPTAARPAVLPGRVPAAAHHHAGRHRVHVPDAHRHAGRPVRARLSSGRHVGLRGPR